MPNVTSCSQCSSGAPSTWSASINPSNDTCQNCANVATPSLDYVSGCTWQSALIQLCGTSYRVQLFFDGASSNWVLRIGARVTYVCAATDWACLGPNTLNRSTPAVNGCSWPDTILVSAA